MTVITMFICGLMFGFGHALAPYIITAFKIRKIAKAQKKLHKKQMKMKGE